MDDCGHCINLKKELNELKISFNEIEINRNNFNVDNYDSSYKNLEPFNLSINNDENIDKSIQKINEISQNEAILNIYDFKYSINPFKKATFL
jgi:glutaredoxin-related protein